MSNLAPFKRTGALTRFDPQFARRLALFKKTSGKDLIGAEIDEAIEFCEVYGANPLTKDIYFFVFSDSSTGERRVTPVLSISLYRKIAARSKDYRPDDKPARFRYDPDLSGPANPKGIVDCEVSVYQFAHNAWHPVTARVRWEERAPIVEGGSGGTEWEDTGEVYPEGHGKAGKKKYRKVPVGEVIVQLDPKKKNWRTMPETMLEKCAEAAAIRKAWPNETAGSYVEGELDRADVIDLTANEILDQAEQQDRMLKVGVDRTILVDWMDGTPLQPVPVGTFHDQAMAFIKKHIKPGEEESAHIAGWAEKNRHSLREFWAMEKDAALSLKTAIEKVAAAAKAAEPELPMERPKK